MNIQDKETAIQEEQQLKLQEEIIKNHTFKTHEEIIEDIIKLLADSKIQIAKSEYLLNEVLKKINTQPVIVVDEHTKLFYRMLNTGKLR